MAQLPQNTFFTMLVQSIAVELALAFGALASASCTLDIMQ